MNLLEKYINIVREEKHNLHSIEINDNNVKSHLVDSALQNLPSEKSTKISTKITNVDKAYKVYSNTLNDYVWIVQDEEAAAELRRYGIQDAIYTRGEIDQLKKTSGSEVSRQLHEIKKLFEKSRIVELKIHEVFDTSRCHNKPAPYGGCHRFTMKLGQDRTLWAYCIRGQAFCPNSVSANGVVKDMNE